MKPSFRFRISFIGKLFIVAAFALYCTNARCQDKYRQKLYAYKEISNTSGISPDTNHAAERGSSTNYLIYIELPTGDTPIWHLAIIGMDVYSVHSTSIGESPLVVGERKPDNRLIKIRPAPDNSLWKLELDLTGEKDSSATDTMDDTVILRGVFKNRKISSAIRVVVELASH